MTLQVSREDYAFDCHTQKGRRMGKTKAEFFRNDQRRWCHSSRVCSTI